MKTIDNSKLLTMDRQSYKRAKKRKKMIYVMEASDIPGRVEAGEKIFVSCPNGKTIKRRVKRIYSGSELLSLSDRTKRRLYPKGCTPQENSCGISLKYIGTGIRALLAVLLAPVLLVGGFVIGMSIFSLIGDWTLHAKYEPDFHTEIAPFDGEVQRVDLPEELPEQVAWACEQPDLTVNKLFVNDTPLYECYRDDGTEKPLLIVMPASGAIKEEIVEEAAIYASMGYYALAIDLDLTGENLHTSPFWEGSGYAEDVYELDALIEFYNGVEQADAAGFLLTGYSVGGRLCYFYGEYGKYKPYAILPRGGGVNDKDIRHPERFLDIYIVAGMGAAEDYDRLSSAQEFEAKLKALGSDKAVFCYYEGLGHVDPLFSVYDGEMRDFLANEEMGTLLINYLAERERGK